MGRITIKVEGSFGEDGVEFTATEGGHTYALTRAIHWLILKQSRAIILDHELHDKGERPPEAEFGHTKRHTPIPG